MLHSVRADAYAETGDWDRASDDLQRATTNGGDLLTWHRVALFGVEIAYSLQLPKQAAKAGTTYEVQKREQISCPAAVL